MQLRDSEVVASIVAGDPDGLAAAYDRYADPLYKYCRFVLSNPADAADAVQDTFVIAACRLAELRDPDQLRAWLYAVARNECLRILRSPQPTPAYTVTPGMADTVIDITEGAAERAELRASLTAAARGLDSAERGALELQLRQGLEPAEVGAVLGLSRSQAQALATRGRDQLEACLAVLFVGRTGRGDCGQLSGMLTGWNGRLTPALRRRAYRHIERCATCATRRVYELRPAVLLGLSPGAAMAAAAADSFRLAAGVPDELKAQTLALAVGEDRGAVAHRAAAGKRAGTFGRYGFPVPLRSPGARPGLRSSARGQTAVAAAVVVAVAVGVVAFALHGTTENLALSGGKTAVSAVPYVASAAGSGRTSAGHGTTAAGPTTQPGQSPTTHATSSASAKASASTATSSASSPAAGPSTTSPAAPVTTTPAATLSVLGPGGVALQPGAQLTLGFGGAVIKLTANGGPVTWSVAVSGDPGNNVFVFGHSSGTLAEGASATVVIFADRKVSGATLTISPGGTAYPLVITSVL